MLAAVVVDCGMDETKKQNSQISLFKKDFAVEANCLHEKSLNSVRCGGWF